MASQTSSTRPGSLETYRKKRRFRPDAGTERAKKKSRGGKRKLRFVVQMHRATRLHYDFRLEADGVLASWAVPKGPTLVPGDRRLAMHVEDHPLDYRDFEGNIPKGQYGAGNVIVWDRGNLLACRRRRSRRTRSRTAKSSSSLHGKKLNGEFTLVKIQAARRRTRRSRGC